MKSLHLQRGEISVWLLLNVFQHCIMAGPDDYIHFSSFGNYKIFIFHNIWYALTLMLELIILSVHYHFNTFIRIYWNFTNAIR